MTPLARVFAAKIAVTALVWAAPLLLAPARLLTATGLPCEAVPLARLLGCAYAALCVGYGLGVREVFAGRHPTSAVAVGIVSNAGAGTYLTYFGVTSSWEGWHPAFPVAAWAFAAATLAIALVLYWFGLRGDVRSGSEAAPDSNRHTST